MMRKGFMKGNEIDKNPRAKTSLLLSHVASQSCRNRRLAVGIGEALVEVEDVARVAEVDAAHLVAAAATRRASCLAALVVGEEVWWLLLVLVALQ